MMNLAKGKLVLPVVVSGFMFMPALVQSASITIDGNLTDLISAIGSNPNAPFNSATAVDGVASAPTSDITNVYAYYDSSADTFYLGMSVVDLGYSSLTEGTSFCPMSSSFGNNASLGGCETYGVFLDIGMDNSKEVQFYFRGDGVANSGMDTEIQNAGNDFGGATIHWAASEINNSIEYSITGITGFADMVALASPSNPIDILINFTGTTITSPGGNQNVPLNMQVVPVPAAAWLFGSGLVGLIGFARRNRKGE